MTTLIFNVSPKIQTMKALRNLITAVFAMLIMTAGFANDGSEADKRQVLLLPCDREGVYKLLYVNDGPEKVTVRIFNQKGRLIKKERIQSNKGFMKPYNLAKHVSGSFRFEVTDQYGTVVLNTAPNPEEEIKK